MTDSNVYQRLAEHLRYLGMGYPPADGLEPILRKNLTPREAEIVLALPTRVIPLQPAGARETAESLGMPQAELEAILDELARKGLIFSGKTEEGEKGYAIQQIAFGFPQAFFWKGEDTERARDLARLVPGYLDLETSEKVYGTPTKAFRFIPVDQSIDVRMQAVYPYHMMEYVIERAKAIAVAHCVCRFRARLLGRTCDHLMEVCIKFDELAEYVIGQGMARRIDKEEARVLMRKCRENDLVHFVDNSVDGVKHNCNCCGCSCWSVGRIRRREIPRDVIMATYFLRETEEGECSGCGDCTEGCPVDCLALNGGTMKVERDWCIGCGICIDKCPTGAARLEMRADRKDRPPEADFRRLHEKILHEKGHGEARP